MNNSQANHDKHGIPKLPLSSIKYVCIHSVKVKELQYTSPGIFGVEDNNTQIVEKKQSNCKYFGKRKT